MIYPANLCPKSYRGQSVDRGDVLSRKLGGVTDNASATVSSGARAGRHRKRHRPRQWLAQQAEPEQYRRRMMTGYTLTCPVRDRGYLQRVGETWVRLRLGDKACRGVDAVPDLDEFARPDQRGQICPRESGRTPGGHGTDANIA